MPEATERTDAKEVLTTSLVDLAVESWRFIKLFERLLQRLDAGEAGKYAGQLRWFQDQLHKALAEAELKIVDGEGWSFDPGAAATALNGEDFAAEDELVVDRMLKPIIMGPDGPVRMGTVMLKKKVES